MESTEQKHGHAICQKVYTIQNCGPDFFKHIVNYLYPTCPLTVSGP
jgi:hypothetical protein